MLVCTVWSVDAFADSCFSSARRMGISWFALVVLRTSLGGSESPADHPGNTDSNAPLASSSFPAGDSFWLQKLNSLGLIVDEIVELSTCIVCSAESSDQGTDLAPHRPDSATVGGEGMALVLDKESPPSAYYTDALTGECKQQ